MSQADLEARIARLEDHRDICNLQGRYNHYLQTGQLKDKLPELFALDHPEVKAEMCDSGLWQGAEGVMHLFKHMGGKYAMAGSLMVHMLLTPVIEVNADRRRARGMWNSLGTNTYKANDGTLEAMWQVGKYDLTFCKEAGRWKYLEFRWYVIFRSPFHEGWVKRPMVEGLHEEGFPPVSPLHAPTIREEPITASCPIRPNRAPSSNSFALTTGAAPCPSSSWPHRAGGPASRARNTSATSSSTTAPSRAGSASRSTAISRTT